MTQVRPELSGNCPSGYLACDPDTKEIDSIVCLPQQDPAGEGRTLAQRCPILDLVIRDRSKALDPALADWQAVNFDSRYEIRYTKQGDQLPVTTLKLSVGEPCMDSKTQVSSNFSSLEVSQTTECPVDT